MTKVAFLGPTGTFTEAAVHGFARTGVLENVELLPQASPAAAVDAVVRGEAEAAVLAIENSVDGAVTQAFDALAAAEGAVQIRAELDLPVAFAIMVRPDFTGEVHSISSHPVGYQQVKGWVAENMPAAQFIPASSNAAAAALVAEGQVDAAAAPERAAELAGLRCVATNVADIEGATTRFVVVGRAAKPAQPTGNDRTSVAFTLPNEAGSLVGALSEFAHRGVNLTRIQSRPTRTQLGSYLFYADLSGHITDAPVAEALRALWLRATTITFLGSWPATDDTALPQPERLAQARAWVEARAAGHPPNARG